MMEDAALSYKMCLSFPPMQCTKGHPCPFHYQDAGDSQKECHIAKNAHHQKVSAYINNPQHKKREWSLAVHIEKESL